MDFSFGFGQLVVKLSARGEAATRQGFLLAAVAILAAVVMWVAR